MHPLHMPAHGRVPHSVVPHSVVTETLLPEAKPRATPLPGRDLAAHPIGRDEVAAYIARGKRLRAEALRAGVVAAGNFLAELLRGLSHRPTRLIGGAASGRGQADALSHDLRTPLTAIRSCSEVLLDHPDMPGDHRRRFIGSIHEETLRLERKIDSLIRSLEGHGPGGARQLHSGI